MTFTYCSQAMAQPEILSENNCLSRSVRFLWKLLIDVVRYYSMADQKTNEIQYRGQCPPPWLLDPVRSQNPENWNIKPWPPTALSPTPCH